MQVYLVGGAVRDKLLGYPTDEFDWVVVGATPEQMQAQGYTPVGKDFPVFLHPHTKDEYALARTERKSGRGYKGFTFNAAPSVTLEEDLIRRDLTINAIAESDKGEITDPYNGQRDIEQRILRHVSPAFREDPVRILRVARFAARYHHLGFRIAEETLALMRQIVDDGEADHLVAERVWKEFSRALSEKSPEIFLQTLANCGAFEKILPELAAFMQTSTAVDKTRNMPIRTDVISALQHATKANTSGIVRFAVTHHDFCLANDDSALEAKPLRTKKTLAIKTMCQRLAIPNEYRDLAILVANFHDDCHKACELKASAIIDLLTQCDAFRQAERFHDFLLCCKLYHQANIAVDGHYPPFDFLRNARSTAAAVPVKNLIDQGYTGQALGTALRESRIDAVKELQQSSPKP